VPAHGHRARGLDQLDGEDLVKRLMIVADHSLVLHAIRLTLRQTAGFTVVGVVDGRRSVSEELRRLQPDVVLVDDMHDTEHAAARLREVREELPTAMALLLTLSMDDEHLEEAFEAGADAALSKAMHPVALGTLLREVVRGNVAQRSRPAREPAVACPLTARELEILRLAADGNTNGQIARQLWVTEQTVKFHLSNTYRKLGVSNRTQASRYAHLNDLVAVPERLAS
jgi:DNA-binding NarL/FixJ family response regulator